MKINHFFDINQGRSEYMLDNILDSLCYEEQEKHTIKGE
jgi:hypothetical protein